MRTAMQTQIGWFRAERVVVEDSLQLRVNAKPAVTCSRGATWRPNHVITWPEIEYLHRMHRRSVGRSVGRSCGS